MKSEYQTPSPHPDPHISDKLFEIPTLHDWTSRESRASERLQKMFNEYDFWNVHGIMNTSGRLQSE